MSFKDLTVELRYRSNEHNIPKDFLCPVLEQTVMYKRAAGYFSTTALVSLSRGLYSMASHNDCHIQLICSPRLSEEDILAIQHGYDLREAINKSLLLEMEKPVRIYEEERLNLIATLIAEGKLDIKLAYMEDDNGINVYHEKIAVFVDQDGNRIAYSGSMNESENGMEENFESFFTFCSWNGGEQQTSLAERDFDQMWEDNTSKIRVIPFPEAVVNKLLAYKKDKLEPNMDSLQYAYEEEKEKLHPSVFNVPSFVSLREYQTQAVLEWKKQGYHGIFSMCTGSGKTFTGLAAMCMLGKIKKDALAVFIICPYIHLVSQWEEELWDWNFMPIICHSQAQDKRWYDKLLRRYRRFKNEGVPFICITTVDTFCGDQIQSIISNMTSDMNVLFMADECHNLGAKSVSRLLPEKIRYRIGMSATVQRHMDKKGTQSLLDYFGKECIEYTLEDGIRDGVLSHYEYHPVPVFLEEDELLLYIELTNRLKKFIIIEDGKTKISEAGKQILFKRSRILAGARQKADVLLELMKRYENDDSILVYCGATTVWDDENGAGKQVDIITGRLKKELGMSVRRFTSQENLEERQEIKRYFKTGQYQVITAIRCLDEGVNIPGIKTAFILASSRNPKEFIQRRGRLLRKSDNKEKAVIYDFVTLPRQLEDILPMNFESDRSIIIGELFRMQEFAGLSDNPYEAEKIMTDIMLAYGTYFDVKEEVEQMEEYYGE